MKVVQEDIAVLAIDAILNAANSDKHTFVIKDKLKRMLTLENTGYTRYLFKQGMC